MFHEMKSNMHLRVKKNFLKMAIKLKELVIY